MFAGCYDNISDLAGHLDLAGCYFSICPAKFKCPAKSGIIIIIACTCKVSLQSLWLKHDCLNLNLLNLILNLNLNLPPSSLHPHPSNLKHFLYQTIRLRYRRTSVFRADFLLICFLGFPDWWFSYSLVFTNKCLWEFLKKIPNYPNTLLRDRGVAD